MINSDEVKKYAGLARIKLTEVEVEGLKDDLVSILSYVSEIQEVDAELGMRRARDHRNVMREDKSPHKTGIYTDALLAGAPEREGDYIKVKKILEK